MSAIKAAKELASSYGQIDGGHHRLWVIDQMVRALCDCPTDKHGTYLTNKKYEKFVREYEADGEYTWETGIAP